MKKIQTFTIDQAARLCMNLTKDTPCAFYDVTKEEWCDKHCRYRKYPAREKDTLKCWRHALKKGWFK